MLILDARLEPGSPHPVVVLPDHIPRIDEMRYEKYQHRNALLYVAEHGGYVSYWFTTGPHPGATRAIELRMRDGTTEEVVPSHWGVPTPAEVAAHRPDLAPQRVWLAASSDSFERLKGDASPGAGGHVTAKLYRDLGELVQYPPTDSTSQGDHLWHVADRGGIYLSWRARWNAEAGLLQAERTRPGRAAWTQAWETSLWADSISGLEQATGQVPHSIAYKLRLAAAPPEAQRRIAAVTERLDALNRSTPDPASRQVAAVQEPPGVHL